MKNRKLKLSLKENYTGSLSVSIMRMNVVNTIAINDSAEIIVDFPDLSPSISGEKVMISFDKEVILNEIDLIRKP